MRTAALLVVFCLMTLLTGSGPAVAEEAFKPAAQKRLDAGMKLYKERKYEEAIKQLREGYAMQGSPVFLYALGQAERMRGNCREAIIYYQTFLDANPLPAQAKAAQLFIDDCRKQPDTGTPSSGAVAPPAAPVAPSAAPPAAPVAPPAAPTAPAPAGAASSPVSPAASAAGAAPGVAPALTAPGAAPAEGRGPGAVSPAPVDAAEVPAAGDPATEALPGVTGPTAEASAASVLGSAPAHRDVPPARREVLGAVLVGVGAAAVAGGAALFFVGRGRAQDATRSLDGFYTAQGWGYAQPTGAAMMGIGAALIGGGVVQYMLVRRRGPSVSLVITPSGGMIGVEGRLP